MGFLDNLKLVKQAMSPEAMKQGWQASQHAMANPTAGATPEQLAAMTPEQRAAYEANMQRIADAQAQISAAHRATIDRELDRRALHGPAGDHVYGALPAAHAADAPTIESTMADTKEQFKDVLRNPFGTRKAPLPPTAPTGPVNRDHQAATERAARDTARQTYLAPHRKPLTFTRIATKRKSQREELAAYLGSSGLSGRPDLVYGVYRVPDDVGAGTFRLTRGGHVVEWEIVHAATARFLETAPAESAYFDADEHWVNRRAGEPSPMDEDLALEYLVRAGVGAHECLGVARFLEINHHSGDGEGSSSYTVTQVAGVLALHAPNRGSGAFDRMRTERPVAAPPAHGVHIEVLNWQAIASAVHPHTHRRCLIPSPFPHLPSSPQELLQSYLEIVGVGPSDSYSAQVTEDDARDLTGVSAKGPMTLRTNRGEAQPCADGEDRPRLVGGAHVVIAYRDRPEYAEGRSRWAGYERDVLQAALSHGTGLRRPVVAPDFLERGVLGKMLRSAEAVHDFVEGLNGDPFQKIPPYRYCWPLAE